MFDDIPNSSSEGDDSTDSKPPTMIVKVTAAAALTGIAHALTDYVLSSEDAFAKFYELLEPEDTSREEMREGIERAHDAFAAMSAQASQQLMMLKLFEAMGMGGDVMPDIDLPSGGMYI